MLDALRDHGARATFFVVGRYVEELPDIVRRAVDEGHELGNHTFDHIDCGHEEDDDVVRDQIARTSAAIERAVGARPRLMRPPYGKDPCRVARIAGELDLSPTVLWSAQAWDWTAPPADKIATRVLQDASPGGIILLHDGAPPGDDRTRDGTVTALDEILPALRERGYEVVTVSELLAAEPAHVAR